MKREIEHFAHAVKKLTAPIERLIVNAIVRGIIQLVDDTTGLQTVQISLLANEIKDGVTRIQHYGFTSVPLSGTECLAICVGGNRDHVLIVGDGDRATRLKNLLNGDTAIYTATGGNSIILRNAGGEIQLVAPGAFTIEGDVAITGNLTVSGDVSDSIRSMAQDRIKFNSHVHPDPQGGNTGTPTPTE